MKRFILCLSFVVLTQSAAAAVPMVRFVRATDSRTIVVEHNGAPEIVHLTNVDVPAADEMAARAYLEDKLKGAFVYVEDGKVYRSPDALFINRELAYGTYAASSTTMRFFGESDPGPRKQAAPRIAPAHVTAKTPLLHPPTQRVKRRR